MVTAHYLQSNFRDKDRVFVIWKKEVPRTDAEYVIRVYEGKTYVYRRDFWKKMKKSMVKCSLKDRICAIGYLLDPDDLREIELVKRKKN